MPFSTAKGGGGGGSVVFEPNFVGGFGSNYFYQYITSGDYNQTYAFDGTPGSGSTLPFDSVIFVEMQAQFRIDPTGLTGSPIAELSPYPQVVMTDFNLSLPMRLILSNWVLGSDGWPVVTVSGHLSTPIKVSDTGEFDAYWAWTSPLGDPAQPYITVDYLIFIAGLDTAG